jgi:hypothetical protein
MQRSAAQVALAAALDERDDVCQDSGRKEGQIESQPFTNYVGGTAGSAICVVGPVSEISLRTSPCPVTRSGS